MKLNEYQQIAERTDLNPNNKDGLLISLLGISGEAGELLTLYKKHLRDGDAYTAFNESVIEELGDILWYVTSVASKTGVSLETIADRNLLKTQERWLKKQDDKLGVGDYDKNFPLSQQLPRQMTFLIKEREGMNIPTAVTYLDEIQIGDPLTDNAYIDDGYRYHDVFHMAYLAVLGWSPVFRKHLNKKRKSDQKIDEVEDGGRAMLIEEGIAALVYSYAQEHQWLSNVNFVDDELLRTIKKMTAHLEVKNRTEKEWEQAILIGYDVWRQLIINKNGYVFADLHAKTLTFQTLGNYYGK